ncbi:SDR family oxidoreductase [Kineosporia babensis]|uniref:SDR family oxidoreductase n=1 Tax=Kineosporia babensis TaxID=499548 RepID=A0A9X1SWA5_9ACTN|nr:SDR family oxidoreductase [Kineosporia babensis]MCD5309388.1 SDR family oxidoreductase [Kineosporia babensis]
MKVVVIGGSGLIGSQVVGMLSEQGHEVVAASPSTGVDTITGEGVAAALAGAQVVVDVSNTPDFAAAQEFFTTSTATLLKAEAEAGVGHHVVLSIVGADRVPDSGYMLAKVAQEEAATAGAAGFSIVRATQFFEFAAGIAAMSQQGDTVHLPTASVQPIASAEVARILAEVAVGEPRNTRLDVAGPQRFGLAEFIRLAMPQADVVADEKALYAGAKVEQDSLVPLGEATISPITLAAWQEAQR